MPSQAQIKNRLAYNKTFLKKGGNMAGLDAYRARTDSHQGIKITIDLTEFQGLRDALEQVPKNVQFRVITNLLKKHGKVWLDRIKTAIPVHDSTKYKDGYAVITKKGSVYKRVKAGNLRDSYSMGVVKNAYGLVLWIGPKLGGAGAGDTLAKPDGWYAWWVLFGAARFGKGYIVPANNYLRFVASKQVQDSMQELANKDIVKYYEYLVKRGISSTKKGVKTITKVA